MTGERVVVLSEERRLKYACACQNERFIETGVAAGKAGIVRTPDDKGRILTCTPTRRP